MPGQKGKLLYLASAWPRAHQHLWGALLAQWGLWARPKGPGKQVHWGIWQLFRFPSWTCSCVLLLQRQIKRSQTISGKGQSGEEKRYISSHSRNCLPLRWAVLTSSGAFFKANVPSALCHQHICREPGQLWLLGRRGTHPLCAMESNSTVCEPDRTSLLYWVDC